MVMLFGIMGDSLERQKIVRGSEAEGLGAQKLTLPTWWKMGTGGKW